MIRAIVIDDSAYNRVTLSRMLQSSGEIEVVATAVNGEEGIRQVVRHRPDLVTLDLEMPVMDGFSFLRWLMANHPTPVIAVSSSSNDKNVFKALELGAIDFISKPGGRVSSRLDEIRNDLLAKARLSGTAHLKTTSAVEPVNRLRDPVHADVAREIDMVVIGASTGGPPALQALLANTRKLPIPFVIAQHMPATFTKLFAERVDKLSAYTVTEAKANEILKPGHVYVAPGGMQTAVERDGERLCLRVTARKTGEVHAPSVNRLFTSASAACGERLMAILLTGMGDDGAEGIRTVKGGGGKTVAESEESAVIFGMPAEAIRGGGVDEVLSLNRIPEAIERICLCAPIE